MDDPIGDPLYTQHIFGLYYNELLLVYNPSCTVSVMAEGGLSLGGSFKEQFDDQLTCSVCLDQYTNPKTLPCHHSFCLKCIQPLPTITKVQ